MFADFCESQKLQEIPKWYPIQEIMRQLYAEAFNYPKTYAAILQQLEWRQTKLPITLEDIHTKMLKSGFVFIHGRDKHHRPIVHMRPLVLNKFGFNDQVDAIIRVICFVSFYMINHMQVRGKVENNLNIIDLQKGKPWELPIKSLSAFQAELGQQFRCMGERNYILNASTPFVWAWKTIKNVLNDSGKAKTVLSGEESCEELTNMVCAC
jgi:hypothetical protein